MRSAWWTRGLVGAVALLGAAWAAPAVAQDGAEAAPTTPEAAYEARVAAMKTFGSGMRTVGQFLRNGTGTIEEVAEATGAMVASASDLDAVLALFPEGSAVGDSEAKPEIWTNHEDFQAKALHLVEAVAALDAAARSGDVDALAAAAQATGASCGGCHELYRAD